MKRKKFSFPIRTTIFVFVVLFFIVLASGNQRTLISTYNINTSKYVEASSIIKPEVTNLNYPKTTFSYYETFSEIVKNGPGEDVSFTSTLTGYGPDCEGCGGKTGCRPYQDVTNGNIYYEDLEYGTVNIVASDMDIPCGSILRLSNLYEEPIITIVLDRGGAIVDKKLDLLFESQADAVWVGRKTNIHTEILRWGW